MNPYISDPAIQNVKPLAVINNLDLIRVALVFAANSSMDDQVDPVYEYGRHLHLTAIIGALDHARAQLAAMGDGDGG